MTKTGLAAVGFGLIGIGSSLIAVPASAAIDCGASPSGGTVSSSGDYCQLSYSTPGSYNFTVPSSASELFALVVGGGGGSSAFYPFHYAGSGGKVTYKDLTNSIETQLTITVGQGGTGLADSPGASGSETIVSSPTTSTDALASGGDASAPAENYCVMPGWSSQLFVGEGARTSHALTGPSASCLDGQGAGVNPSVGDADSAGTPVPSIFSDLNQTFGTGGRIVRLPNTLDLPQTSGNGAGLELGITDDTLSGPARNGGNGVAILRWRSVATLANTGSSAGDLSALAAGLIAAGISLNIAAKLRRRVSK